MKPLYTEEEFNKAKSKDKLICECYVCNKPFPKSKRDIQKVLNNIPGFSGKYCSHSCLAVDRSKRQIVTCKQCKKEISKQQKEINEKGNFCSHSCSAIFQNSKRTKSKHKCKICQSRTFGKETLCSTCTISEKIKEWESGKLNLSTKYGHSNLIRNYLLKKHNSKCSKCGFCGTNEKTGNSILHVDHIDGDWSNSTYNNVRLLCPNCHAMTSTYGALNKGKGRKWKSKYSIHKK